MSDILSTKEIQRYELDIIRALDAFTSEQGLCYYLAGGTLLGAIRHKGFIPWDDDVDLMMPREDYTRLVRTFRHPRYRLEECLTDEHCENPFARIWDTHTVLEWNRTTDHSLGIFIDIFPIDGYPENEFFARLHTARLWILRMQNNLSRKKFRKNEKYVPLKKLLMLLFRKSPNTYAVRLNRLAMNYPFSSSAYVGVTTTTDHLFKERNRKADIFRSALRLPFEDLSLPVPSGYDLYLKRLFGDYMQLPPEDKRVSEHDFTVRTKD